MLNKVSIAAREADRIRRVDNLNIFAAVEKVSERFQVSPKSVYKELELLWPDRYTNFFTWKWE